MDLKKYINELKRRNVFKAGISFVIFSWILIQVASILYPSFGWGQVAINNTLIILILLFPFWIVFAYVFEWTPHGFKKTKNVQKENSIATETGKKIKGVIIAGLSLAVFLLVTDRIFNITGATLNKKLDRSIAVLAFADMSPNKNQEYFSDGISEEILNLLAKIPNLKVISRTSSFSYKDKEQDIKKIGQELNVAHILEGSVRKSGNKVRITAQLIDVEDGTHLWSETYDRDLDDIFKIQDEISQKVTRQLEVAILGEIKPSRKTNPEAYNLYLQAKQLSLQYSAETNQNAEKIIRQSIALDSTYAPSWVLLSEVIYKSCIIYIEEPIETCRVKGNSAIVRAIQLDPQNPMAYSLLARYKEIDWDFKAATRNIKKALELAPDNAEIIRRASFLNFGRQEEAIALIKKSLELDPLNFNSYYNLALGYWWNEEFAEAEAAIRQYILMNPNSGRAHGLLGFILMHQGHKEQALIEISKDDDPFWGVYRKCMALYAWEDGLEANRLLKEFIEKFGNSAWPNIAHVYAFRGEKDKAFYWLELAYKNRDASLTEILDYPEFKSLYGDPRWNAFINKLGLPEDHGYHLD